MKLLARKMLSSITPGLFGLAVLVTAMAGCGDLDSQTTPHVTITPLASYFKVEIDYSSGDYFDIGREYGMKNPGPCSGL